MVSNATVALLREKQAGESVEQCYHVETSMVLFEVRQGRNINKQSWDIFFEAFGGGPVLFIKFPTKCKDTLGWLSSKRLCDIGKILE